MAAQHVCQADIGGPDIGDKHRIAIERQFARAKGIGKIGQMCGTPARAQPDSAHCQLIDHFFFQIRQRLIGGYPEIVFQPVGRSHVERDNIAPGL